MRVCYEGNGSARSRRNAFRSERHKTARCKGTLTPAVAIGPGDRPQGVHVSIKLSERERSDHVGNLQWLEIAGGFQNRPVIGPAADRQLQLAGDIEHAVVIRKN